LSLHEKAIYWITKQYPGAISNHYAHYSNKIIMDKLIPDIIIGEKIHEVETVSDKACYKRIPNDKTLWIIIPSFEVFNRINIVGYTNNVFTPLNVMSDLKIRSETVLTEHLDIEKLKNEILTRKTERNRLIRTTKLLKKQHEIKAAKAKRILYLLPSFQFEKELDPDKCAICSNESAVEIGKEGKPWYGLCQLHFDALNDIDEA